MGYYTGQRVYIRGATAYASSTTSRSAGSKSGSFYIWSGATRNGRIRITTNKSYCGRLPAGKYVTCWIKTSAIGNSGSSSASSQKKAVKKTTVKPKKVATPAKTVKKAAALKNKGAGKKITTIAPKKKSKTTSKATPQKVKPGQIGYLGAVLFIVSEKTIETIEHFSMSSSANYVEHERHLRTPTVEFTGVNAKTIKFDMTLSAYLGVDPMKAYKKLEEYEDTGTAVPFKLGKTTYGKYRWCIKGLDFSGEFTDPAGNWLQAKVSITLIGVEKKG